MWKYFFRQLASAIKPADDSKPAEPPKADAGTAAPAAAGAAAAAPAPTLVNLELTPDMTSDNPLETRNLAFYTQTIGEGTECIVKLKKCKNLPRCVLSVV